ncbi:histidine utilization repressor [Martelella alba]|uniref:Histidine utilization repressor n=1 Tax=Martelella alba TaxID=2590451 RepID=A0A506UBV4_9HYPH|nr:histidine utilization repressor [Martelella alba]TPW30876.1 histidine utilization repressor [Martelella alba]
MVAGGQNGKKGEKLPLHARIQHDVESKIMSGEWPPGFRIPFEHELTDTYGCSRMTVNKALSELSKKGLIERRRKSGSFVCQPEVLSAVMEIHQLDREVTALGLHYSFRRLAQLERLASVEDVTRLSIDRPVPVLCVTSLHKAGERLFCYEERLINLDVVPAAREADFDLTPPGTWLLEQVPWSAAEHRIRAIGAQGRAASALELAPGTPCLIISRRTWNAAGAITHVRLTYPGDMHTLVAEFSPSQRAR